MPFYAKYLGLPLLLGRYLKIINSKTHKTSFRSQMKHYSRQVHVAVAVPLM